MSRPLRMDEMGPGISSHTLEACRMSNEASADDEVAARVRATVAGDFQPEHVNGFPMRPDQGSIDLLVLFLFMVPILNFLQPSLRLIFARAGIDRRSILEASGEGG